MAGDKIKLAEKTINLSDRGNARIRQTVLALRLDQNTSLNFRIDMLNDAQPLADQAAAVLLNQASLYCIASHEWANTQQIGTFIQNQSHKHFRPHSRRSEINTQARAERHNSNYLRALL
jgi:hypothetical protein